MKKIKYPRSGLWLEYDLFIEELISKEDIASLANQLIDLSKRVKWIGEIIGNKVEVKDGK